MLEDETKWEVQIRSPKAKEWSVVCTYDYYHLAKERYMYIMNFKAEYSVRIVRVEIHRSVVLEDLRGNLDD